MATSVRDLLVTFPERLRAARRALTARLEAVLLRLIDRFLARRDEERAAKLLNFDELPVLYDEADFPVVLDKALGWSGNSTPDALTIENPLWYDYA